MKYKTGVFIWIPFLLAVTSAHFKSICLYLQQQFSYLLWLLFYRLLIKGRIFSCSSSVLFVAFRLMSSFLMSIRSGDI